MAVVNVSGAAYAHPGGATLFSDVSFKVRSGLRVQGADGLAKQISTSLITSGPPCGLESRESRCPGREGQTLRLLTEPSQFLQAHGLGRGHAFRHSLQLVLGSGPRSGRAGLLLSRCPLGLHHTGV